MHASRTEAGTSRTLPAALQPSLSAKVLSPGDEFWRKIEAGEGFTEQELEDALAIGRGGTVRVGKAAAPGAVGDSLDPGSVAAFWTGEIAGFEGYVSFGVQTAALRFEVAFVPRELYTKSTEGALSSDAIIRVTFNKEGDRWRADLEDPRPGTRAFNALEHKGRIEPTGDRDDAGDEYHRVVLDSPKTVTRFVKQEAIRRLALHLGEVPIIFYSERATGAMAGKGIGKEYSREQVKAKFSREADNAEMSESRSWPELESALRDYEETGDNFATVNDLADHIEGLLVSDEAPQELQDALYAYRDEQEDDRRLGGRGDMDTANDAFLDAIRAAIGGAKFSRAPATDTEAAIRFSRATAQPGAWDAPEPTRTDKSIYTAQDGRIDLKRVQQSIKDAGREIEEKFDARLAETLYPGRVAYRSQRFLETEAKPLLEMMAAARMTPVELADYLLARHAPERNAHIAEINPDLPDGGAGTNSKGELMTTEAAGKYIADLEPARRKVLESIAARVDRITAGTRKLLVSEGLEKPEVVKAWEDAYQFYAPLFKDEAEAGVPHPIGTGFSVKGAASKRATGSTKKVTDVLGHVLMQREAAITRAEKNRVGLSLYGLALSHPNPEFWTTIRPNMSKAQIAASLRDMGVAPDEAMAAMDGVPTIRTVDEKTNRVVDRPNPIYKSLPGAMVVKLGGEDRVILFNVRNERAARLAGNLKNLDGLTNLDIAGSFIGKATRWIASVNTQYNPVFGFINVTRDVLGAAFNLSNTSLAGHQREVLGNVPAALIGIARDLRNDSKRTDWSDLFREFQEAGGRTGYRELFREAADRTKAIERELAQLQAAGKLAPGKATHAVLDLLDGFNSALENAVRLSTYKAGLDKGLSKPEAARIARELTVDFNRKGVAGRELGPLYAFFNASMQGSARTIQTLKGPAGLKIIAGGFALGALQALMLAAAGFDDDDLPEFVQSRNLIIPTGWRSHEKTYVAIPYPLGLHVLPNLGRVATELALNDGKDAPKKIGEAVGEVLSAFNPFGGGNIFTADGALKTIAPTVVDPVIELIANRNFAGGQIERRPFNEEGDARPGFVRARESTQRSVTGQVYLGISKSINYLTGGTDYEAGLASPTPEAVRYLAQVAGGGVLREFEKAVNTSVDAATGQPLKQNAIPLVGRFFGEVDEASVEARRFYEAKNRVNRAHSAMKAADKADDAAAHGKLVKKYPEAEFHADLQNAQQAISRLNKLAAETINDREELQRIDRERTEAMKDFNDALRKMESKGPTAADQLRALVR